MNCMTRSLWILDWPLSIRVRELILFCFLFRFAETENYSLVYSDIQNGSLGMEIIKYKESKLIIG